jgi:TRAP-type uncharacterized transport system fused permease subunit
MANTNTTNKQQDFKTENAPRPTEKVAQSFSQQSDFDYYTSKPFLKRASISIVPVGLIIAYSYHKKFSLTKSAFLVSIPIVIITGLQYIFMGGGKNKYWQIFTPPSARNQYIKQVKPIVK